jgi:dihydrofolate reductase
MRIIAVAAMSENRVIGYRKQLPWKHMAADLHRFKTVTMGKPILMGRSTYDSIGKPLSGRCNIVITRDPELCAPGCVIVNSIERAIEAAGYSEEIYIIGGASLYEHLLPRAQRIYLTHIHHKFDGDTYFPELNMKEWKEVAREAHKADDKNPYPYTFVTLDRI